MSKPDTKQASELYELCREVYEATGWKYTIGKFHDDGSYDGYVGHRGIAYTPNPQNAEWLPKDIPLYTSDYLLEKLPPALWVEVSGEGKQVALLALNMQGNGEAIAVYEIPYDKEFRGSYSRRADTPLKALLKLTLKLHEEKML